MASLAKVVENELSILGRTSVLEQVDTLPRSKCSAPLLDWDCKTCLSERGPQVRWHIVRPLAAMLVNGRVFRRDALEIGFHVPSGRRRGILLDQEGTTRMATEDRQQPVAGRMLAKPCFYLRRDLDEALAASAE